MAEPQVCEYDGKTFTPTRAGARFCCDRCRANWHREHDPEGVVRSVRRLTDGRTAVVVHFAEGEAERALQLSLRERVVLGAVGAKVVAA